MEDYEKMLADFERMKKNEYERIADRVLAERAAEAEKIAGPDPRDAEIAALKARAERAEAEADHLNRLNAVVGALTAWTHEYGAALKPPGADTYGEGKRDAKDEVAAILRRMG